MILSQPIHETCSSPAIAEKPPTEDAASDSSRPSSRRFQKVDITVEPLGQTDFDPLFIVVFRDVGQPVAPTELEAQRRPLSADEGTVDRLEQELRDSRDRLQATIEEYETAVRPQQSNDPRRRTASGL